MLEQVTQEFSGFLQTVELANHIASESILDEVLEAALERMPQPSQAYLDEVAKREASPQPSTN